MGAVLAVPLDLEEAFGLVEHVVAVGVADPIEAARVLLDRVDDDIEAVERPEQPLGLADRDRDRLDLDLGRRAPTFGGVTR